MSTLAHHGSTDSSVYRSAAHRANRVLQSSQPFVPFQIRCSTLLAPVRDWRRPTPHAQQQATTRHPGHPPSVAQRQTAGRLSASVVHHNNSFHSKFAVVPSSRQSATGAAPSTHARQQPTIEAIHAIPPQCLSDRPQAGSVPQWFTTSSDSVIPPPKSVQTTQNPYI
jgi:hypothetical protein